MRACVLRQSLRFYSSVRLFVGSFFCSNLCVYRALYYSAEETCLRVHRTNSSNMHGLVRATSKNFVRFLLPDFFAYDRTQNLEFCATTCTTHDLLATWRAVPIYRAIFSKISSSIARSNKKLRIFVQNGHFYYLFRGFINDSLDELMNFKNCFEKFKNVSTVVRNNACNLSRVFRAISTKISSTRSVTCTLLNMSHQHSRSIERKLERAFVYHFMTDERN